MRDSFPKWLLFAFFVPFVATLLYGIALFPDAPLKARDGVITGKTGRTRTIAEYHFFPPWERTFIVVGTICVGTMAGWAVRHPGPGIRFDALWHRRPPKA